MNMTTSPTQTPTPSIPSTRPMSTHVVSMTAPAASQTRRIHPLPIAAAIAVSGLFAGIGLLLILSIYGLMLGVPLLTGAITEMILLGRHRDPRATHPAWPLAISAVIGLAISAMVATIDDWLSVGLIGFAVFGAHGLIALGLWKTTTQSSAPAHTTGQG